MTHDLDWQDDALCRKRRLPVDWFFPGSGHRPHPEAVAACDACEVRKECGDYAVRFDEWSGYWGGRTARERKNRDRKLEPGSRRHDQTD